jgi:hypothetical protein
MAEAVREEVPRANGAAPGANGAAPGANGAVVANGAAPGANGEAPVASGAEPQVSGPPAPQTTETAALIADPLTGGPSGPGEVGEPIAVDEFQGDILGRKYCVGKTPEGDYFFDYAKPPPGCDLNKIKFFRVTGTSMAEVEAELKKLLGTVNAPSSTANTSVSSNVPFPPGYGPTMANMSGRPVRPESEIQANLDAQLAARSLVARSPVTQRWLQTAPELAAAAGISYTNRSGLRGGNATRKHKKSRKETSRKQSK